MYQIINPFNGAIIQQLEYDSESKCEYSLKQLDHKINQKRTIAHRVEILNNLSRLLEENQEQLIRQISLEIGKTYKDSLIEIKRSILSVKCTASELASMKDETIDSDSYLSNPLDGQNRMAIVKRFPIGTILAISPFNFPINLALHKIAPAFAMGNSILFKPHPQCIGSSQLLTNFCYQSGFLDTDLQMINPTIEHFQKIIQNEKIQCLSFTGGYSTACSIAKIAGVKKQLYELGGNDALVIFEDGDLKKAVEVSINQRFRCSGQRCTAPKRIFVHNSVINTFKELLIKETQKLIIGDPLNQQVDIGPVVNQAAAEVIWSRLNSAVENGAKILAGMKREGNIIHPTILENVPLSHLLVREETFGPVIPLFSFDSIDEVIAGVNSSQYALQCGVFTQNIHIMKKMFQEIESGSVINNDGPAYRQDHLPFGGVKRSGYGREGISYTLKEMSIIKSLVI